MPEPDSAESEQSSTPSADPGPWAPRSEWNPQHTRWPDVPWPEPNTMGYRFRERREELNWSQKQVARHLGGLNQGTVSRWENNVIPPGDNRVEQVAVFLGVPPHVIPTYRSKPPPYAVTAAEMKQDVDDLKAQSRRLERQVDVLIDIVGRLASREGLSLDLPDDEPPTRP